MMIYAAEFKDGRIKIGIPSCVNSRVCSLKNAYGSKVVRHMSCGPVVGRMIEAAAHRAAEIISSKRKGEVFYGLRFGEAVCAIRHAVSRQAYIAQKHYKDKRIRNNLKKAQRYWLP